MKNSFQSDFDDMLDQHFSNDTNIKRGVKNMGSKGPNFSNTMKKVAETRDETYHEKRKQGLGQRDNSYQAIDNARPEKKAQISKSLKENYKKTPEHLAKVAAKNRERSKPIQTPYGEFPSRRAAAEHMISIGIPNASRKLDKFLKTDPTNYFYF